MQLINCMLWQFFDFIVWLAVTPIAV